MLFSFCSHWRSSDHSPHPLHRTPFSSLLSSIAIFVTFLMFLWILCLYFQANFCNSRICLPGLVLWLLRRAIFLSLFHSDMEISKQKHTLQSTLGEYQSRPPLWLQVSWLGCRCFSGDFWSFAFQRSSYMAYTIVLEWLSCCYVWKLSPWWKCYFFLVMIGFYF